MDKKIEHQITEIIDQMEKMARDYELAIRKGKFEIKSPYPKIIKIYEDINQILIKLGWDRQAVIIKKQIKFYSKKLETDKTLREIEAQKVEKQRKFEELYKIKEIDSIRAVIDQLNKEQEILNFEEKKKEKDKESEDTFNLISNAEKIVREYERKTKQDNILHLDCPYEKVIKIYKEAKRKFESIGWQEESNKLIESIRYYKEKLVKDKKLREIEEKKLINKF
jgi:hypothetical protein